MNETDEAQAALFRVMHGPENVRALKRIARKFFQGRTPTIVATLEHRTRELEEMRELLAEVVEEAMDVISDYDVMSNQEMPKGIQRAAKLLAGGAR